MDEKLICCQVCQVYFFQCQCLFSTKSACMGSTTNQTSQPNPSTQTEMFPPRPLCPCTVEDFIKMGKFQDKTPKAQIASRKFGVQLVWTAVQQEQRGGRGTIVAGDRENYFTARNQADASAPLADGKLETWSHSCKMRYRHLPHMDANIKCVLFQCLPYLPMPCYAVHMCCSNQANFIASGWVDQKDPHSLFLLCCALPLSCSNLRKRQN